MVRQMESKPKIKGFDTDQRIQKVTESLDSLNEKLEQLININKQILDANQRLLNLYSTTSNGRELTLTPDTLSILSLPMSLRKTIMVLYKVEKATADELAKETHRFRAVESAAANELVRMGYVNKRREGRDVYFFLNSSEGGKN